MKNGVSLRTEIIAGLLALILLSSGVTMAVSFLMSRRAFDDLVEQNDLQVARTLSERLGAWYGENGGWDGIALEIRFLKRTGNYDSQESGDHIRKGHPHPDVDDMPVMVLDAGSTIVYNGFLDRDRDDGIGRLEAGTNMDSRDGTPVVSGGRTVGWVFFRSMIYASYNPREAGFLQSLVLSLAWGVLMGVAISIGLGMFLAGRLTRPLARLQTAVAGITAGDLDTRVQEGGSREVAALAARFNIMATRLKATEQARQDLIADVAHELRTPVSILQANLEMLMEGVYQPDRARLVSLYEETCLLARLVGDLRTLNDMDLGIVTISPEPLDLCSLVRDAADRHRPLLEGAGMQLELEVVSGSARVSGDAQRLTQVLHNLLDNARKYAEGSALVRLSLGLLATDGGPRVRVSVRDYGPGVNPGERDRIFERFYRVDRSRNRETGGRGLGLSLSRQYIEACGGHMGADAPGDRGLEVWFTLPLIPS